MLCGAVGSLKNRIQPGRGFCEGSENGSINFSFGKLTFCFFKLCAQLLIFLKLSKEQFQQIRTAELFYILIGHGVPHFRKNDYLLK